MEKEKIKEIIIQKMIDGKISYRTIEGIFSCPIEDFVKQPLYGMLYDLNRDKATIFAFLDDPKWVNDLALTQLLEYYYFKCQKLEKEIEELKEKLKNDE